MHRLAFALVAFLTFSDIPSAVRQYRMFADAYDRQRNSDPAGAARGYAELLARHPAGFFRNEALFDLALIHQGQKQPQQASTIYAGLLQVKGPIGVNAAYNQGNIIASQAFTNPKAADYPARLRNALAFYRRALTGDPGHADARVNYEIVLRALRTIEPPRPASGGGEGAGSPGTRPQQQGLSSDVSNLVLGNARQDEGQMMRKYFRPAAPRQIPKEEKEW
ncbi:MAG: hypothetical protein HGB04_06185 [Chlorobiaceae bacterium]|nr:hypothetical protein [Chlorobiaceae bacterium]